MGRALQSAQALLPSLSLDTGSSRVGEKQGYKGRMDGRDLVRTERTSVDRKKERVNPGGTSCREEQPVSTQTGSPSEGPGPADLAVGRLLPLCPRLP